MPGAISVAIPQLKALAEAPSACTWLIIYNLIGTPGQVQ